MVVKIQVGYGPTLGRNKGKNRRLALIAGAVLTPAALVACVLAFWRLSSDLNWTGEFAISSGLFSHWQVWIVMGVLLQFCASTLNRYGRGAGAAMP